MTPPEDIIVFDDCMIELSPRARKFYAQRRYEPASRQLASAWVDNPAALDSLYTGESPFDLSAAA
jgi:hypothetical protein